MDKNKAILKHCPNFYKIINFEYLEDDELSERLIKVYHDYVFKVDIRDKVQVNRLETLDSVLNKYIDDYFFRRDMKNRLLDIRVKKNSNDFMRNIVESIINAFDNYEMGYTRNIYFARWI